MTNQLTSQALRSKMKIPPPLQGPYQKVVMAGQKIMYSQQMAGQIQALLKTGDPLGKKIGDGAVALIGLLIDQSHHTLPPQLIIPSGIEFCTDFADLLRGAGMQVSDQDVALGMETYVASILQKFQITPDKLAALAKGGPQAVQGQQPPAGPAAPTAPAAPAAPAAPTNAVAADSQGN